MRGGLDGRGGAVRGVAPPEFLDLGRGGVDVRVELGDVEAGGGSRLCHQQSRLFVLRGAAAVDGRAAAI